MEERFLEVHFHSKELFLLMVLGPCGRWEAITRDLPDRLPYHRPTAAWAHQRRRGKSCFCPQPSSMLWGEPSPVHLVNKKEETIQSCQKAGYSATGYGSMVQTLNRKHADTTSEFPVFYWRCYHDKSTFLSCLTVLLVCLISLSRLVFLRAGTMPNSFLQHCQVIIRIAGNIRGLVTYENAVLWLCIFYFNYLNKSLHNPLLSPFYIWKKLWYREVEYLPPSCKASNRLETQTQIWLIQQPPTLL